jgi:formamidopyrimidine-DNA glycosylase
VPELPEIAHLKRTLEPLLRRAVVRRVSLVRPDVLRNIDHPEHRGRIARRTLLHGQRIANLLRHGKELALLSDSGRILCVHLGMTGSLRVCPAGRALRPTDHVHCIWTIRGGRGDGRLVFRDPRRFGGLWAFADFAALHETRWSRLGPDALTVGARTLWARLARTRRAVKAALLDQKVLAGIGNIYADESLFGAGIHPMTPACTLAPPRAGRLAREIRGVLRRAIAAGGSTIRDYRDGRGEAGGFSPLHRVYGRGGLPCLQCRATLRSMRVSQRTTVYCPRCQRPQRPYAPADRG